MFESFFGRDGNHGGFSNFGFGFEDDDLMWFFQRGVWKRLLNGKNFGKFKMGFDDDDDYGFVSILEGEWVKV